MKGSLLLSLISLFSWESADSFVVLTPSSQTLKNTFSRPVTSLGAIAALAKKAKQNELRQYVEAGVPESVMKIYQEMQNKYKTIDLLANDLPNKLQQELTRRRGTLTIIAEYNRKTRFTDSGIIKDLYDPEVVSPIFREYLASAIAVTADERMGACDYSTLEAFVKEQKRSHMEVPGPVKVINNDLILDELQIARTVDVGADAVVLSAAVLEKDELEKLLKCTAAVDLEAIVAVTSAEQAQQAIDIGARMISVQGIGDNEERAALLRSLKMPEGRTVTTICNLGAAKGKGDLQEIEDAWFLRDKGYNSIIVGETLYKSGSLDIEHPGVIIRSMKSKSSLKFASPKASNGRGEGAREYLGDILM
jgi:indole-3-glycerol phosphate synthase